MIKEVANEFINLYMRLSSLKIIQYTAMSKAQVFSKGFTNDGCLIP